MFHVEHLGCRMPGYTQSMSGKAIYFTAFLIIAVAVASAHARLVPSYPVLATPEIEAKPADIVINAPPDTLFHDAALGADGESIFAMREVEAINIWALTVYYWPELSLPPLFILLLLTLIRLWKRWRIRGPSDAEFVAASAAIR